MYIKTIMKIISLKFSKYCKKKLLINKQIKSDIIVL